MPAEVKSVKALKGLFLLCGSFYTFFFIYFTLSPILPWILKTRNSILSIFCFLAIMTFFIALKLLITIFHQSLFILRIILFTNDVISLKPSVFHLEKQYTTLLLLQSYFIRHSLPNLDSESLSGILLLYQNFRWPCLVDKKSWKSGKNNYGFVFFLISVRLNVDTKISKWQQSTGCSFNIFERVLNMNIISKKTYCITERSGQWWNNE